MGSNTWKEQLAFKAIDGSEITRSREEDMANFIATDGGDKSVYGNVWGSNFLNDGVIRKDFFQTGLAQVLVKFYQADLRDDLQKRLAKEKKYRLYTHPQARFIGVENVWNYFMPEAANDFQTLKVVQNATDPEAFNARVRLFLSQDRLPASTLKQILRYQEKQYSWLMPDPNLEQMDLSLFGYRNLEEWFGPRFTHLVSQFIINAAILAEEKGYRVSDAEVMADLVRSTEVSYQQNKNNPYLGVATPEEYFNEQLRRLSMDKMRAINVWRQVMLFRRYFQDVGNAVLVDTLAYQKFNDFANQAMTVDLYHLPTDLRLSNYTALQNFEIYLNAVSKAPKDPLALPTVFLSPAEIAKNYPELVQKRYLLESAQTGKKHLQSRAGVRETLNWQLDDNNWVVLKKQFPELGVKKDSSREARLAALEGLDSMTLAKVDSYARSALVDAHPEWLERGLEGARAEVKIVGLSLEGGQAPFSGVNKREQRQKLARLLDQAPLNQLDPSISAFTADQQTYYRIKVLGRDEQPSVLTFAEANANGSLDEIRNRLLEAHYLAIREQNPSLYQKEDRSWKNFEAVRDLVADHYFEKTLNALQQLQKSGLGQGNSKDQVAALRFYSYLQQVKSQIEKDPFRINQFVRGDQETDLDQLLPRQALATQWLLERSIEKLGRNKPHESINFAEAFALPENTWSAISTSANGGLTFFQIKGKGAASEGQSAIAKQTQKAHQILSAEAQSLLMQHVLQQIADKKAISLAYLTSPSAQEGLPAPGEEIIAPEF